MNRAGPVRRLDWRRAGRHPRSIRRERGDSMNDGVASERGRQGFGRARFLAGGAALAAAAAAVGLAGVAAADDGRLTQARPPERFEVAENGLRFIFDETPVHPDGQPAYGNPFVTE